MNRGVARGLLWMTLFGGASATASPRDGSEGYSRPHRSPAESESSKQPHYYRASLEMLGFLGLGAAWYWIDLERNLADWDRLSLKQRFRIDAIRLDNNEFWVNYIAHPFAGAGYYAFSRSNGLSVLESSGFALLTSMAWEYGLEFQERTSYNDFFVTPGAGISVGESAFRLGEYLNSGCGPSLAKAFGWVVGFPTALHRALDGDPGCSGPRDSLGLSARTFHRFDTAYEVRALSGTRVRYRHGGSIDSEIISLDSYTTTESQGDWFHAAEWTRLHLGLYPNERLGGWSLASHAALVGYHLQSRSGSAAVRLITGLGLGFDYQVAQYPDFRERFTSFHMPGWYYRSQLSWGGLRFAVDGRLSFEFASTNSLPYAQFRQDHQGLTGKSVLRKQAYYYGFGGSGELAARVEWRFVEVGAFARYGLVDSVEGQDRTQEQLDIDEEAVDERDTVGAFVGVRHVGTMKFKPFAQLFTERFRRRSALEGRVERRTSSQYGLNLGVSF